jgi:sugar phosphate isomerase/epimerase
MKIAFSTISCPDYTAAQIAEAVHAYGYDGVELYALEGQRLLPDLLAARLDEVREALRDIPIYSINSWAKLSSADPEIRQAQARQIEQSFQLAAELNCPLVKTFGGELPEGHAPAAVFDYMAETIAALADRGQALEITLVLETHDGFARGASVAELLQRVEHPNFAALWDVHHPYRMGEAVAETDNYIGPRVRHMHVKDATRTGASWNFVLLGEGELPVQAAIQAMAQRGYRGAIAVDWEKMWHPEIAGPEIALPQYAAYLRRMIDVAG